MLYNLYNEKKDNRKEKFWFRAIFYLFLLIFIGTVCWIFFFSSLLKINSVEVIFQETQTEYDLFNKDYLISLVKTAFQTESSGFYLDHISRANFFLFNVDHFSQLIEKKSLWISKVEIYKKFPQSIQIIIIPRDGAFILQGEEDFLVDGQGMVFAKKNDFLKESATLPILSFEMKRSVKINDQVLESKSAKFLTIISSIFSEQSGFELKPEFFTPSLISNELEAQVVIDNGWKIFFNTERDPVIQSKLVRKVLDEVIKEKISDLEYIDLRLPGKVIYKLKGQPINADDSDAQESKSESKEKKDDRN